MVFFNNMQEYLTNNFYIAKYQNALVKMQSSDYILFYRRIFPFIITNTKIGVLIAIKFLYI